MQRLRGVKILLFLVMEDTPILLSLGVGLATMGTVAGWMSLMPIFEWLVYGGVIMVGMWSGYRFALFLWALNTLSFTWWTRDLLSVLVAFMAVTLSLYLVNPDVAYVGCWSTAVGTYCGFVAHLYRSVSSRGRMYGS